MTVVMDRGRCMYVHGRLASSRSKRGMRNNPLFWCTLKWTVHMVPLIGRVEPGDQSTSVYTHDNGAKNVETTNPRRFTDWPSSQNQTEQISTQNKQLVVLFLVPCHHHHDDPSGCIGSSTPLSTEVIKTSCIHFTWGFVVQKAQVQQGNFNN